MNLIITTLKNQVCSVCQHDFEFSTDDNTVGVMFEGHVCIECYIAQNPTILDEIGWMFSPETLAELTQKYVTQSDNKGNKA